MAGPTTTLLSHCSRAATAAEARYRIDAPIAASRGVRVVALDEGAVALAVRLAAQEWATARFLVCAMTGDRIVLRGINGAQVDVDEQLNRADVVVMIASDDVAATAASTLGRACWDRSVMTAGLVLGDDLTAEHAVAALRPHARVLLAPADETDVVELLTALRA